jgi:hypothetical protein
MYNKSQVLVDRTLCCPPFFFLFFFVCLRPVFYVPNVASVSGLSIRHCSFDFLYCLFRNTNCIVSALNRQQLDPTIYHTRAEHASHYAIDVVSISIQVDIIPQIMTKSVINKNAIILNNINNIFNLRCIWFILTAIFPSIDRFCKIWHDLWYIGRVIFLEYIFDFELVDIIPQIILIIITISCKQRQRRNTDYWTNNTLGNW